MVFSVYVRETVTEWNGIVTQLLSVLNDDSIHEMGLLRECLSASNSILQMQKRNNAFTQFKGIEILFNLVQRLHKFPNNYTDSITHENYELLCMLFILKKKIFEMDGFCFYGLFVF